jgi:hypothetical protein
VRQPGVHAEPARLVGGGCHDAALGRVAVAAADDQSAAQFGPSPDLDSHDELVEVHVQYRSRFSVAGMRVPASADACRGPC